MSIWTVFTTDVIGPIGSFLREDANIMKIRNFFTTRIIGPIKSFFRGDACGDAWPWLMALLGLYSTFIAPFEFGFVPDPTLPLKLVDRVLDGIFAIDFARTVIMIYCNGASDDNSRFDTIVLCLIKLASWIIPICTWGVSIVKDSLRLCRALRFLHVHSLSLRLEKNITWNYFRVRCTKLYLVILVAVHCEGCFYSQAATRSKDGHNWFESLLPQFHDMSLVNQYIATMYWSMTTMTTVGYGDLHAENPEKMIFTIIFMLVNLALGVYLLGNMTNLIVNINAQTWNYRAAVQSILIFSVRHCLPPSTQGDLLAHMQTKFLDEENLVANLPKSLCTIMVFLPTLKEVYLFKDTSPSFLRQLVRAVKVEDYLPEEEVISQNESPSQLYIMVSGSMTVIANGAVRLEKIAQGDVIGELGVLCNSRLPFSVRTRSFTQLLLLDRTQFTSILQANLEHRQKVLDNLTQHWRQDHGMFSDLPLEIRNVLLSGGLF